MTGAVTAGAQIRRRSLRAFLDPRGRWLLSLAVAFAALIAFLAMFGILLAPDATMQHLSVGVTEPSFGAPLGTDSVGRDVFAQVIAGTRSAVVGPLMIAIGTAIISLVVGVWAGYRGGLVDSSVMRLVDLGYSIPPLLLVIIVVGLLGGGYLLAVLALILVSVPYDIRIIRAVSLEQRNLPYVDAARTLGLSRSRIMARHIGPNVVPFVIVNSCLGFAFALVTLASLSFLGLGSPPGSADWGRMLGENREVIFQNPAAVFGPAAMVVLTAASVNLIGDSLGERLKTGPAGDEA